MKEPRVSVAMTTYNGEQFVAEQLESFVSQLRLDAREAPIWGRWRMADE